MSNLIWVQFSAKAKVHHRLLRKREAAPIMLTKALMRHWRDSSQWSSKLNNGLLRETTLPARRLTHALQASNENRDHSATSRLPWNQRGSGRDKHMLMKIKRGSIFLDTTLIQTSLRSEPTEGRRVRQDKCRTWKDRTHSKILAKSKSQQHYLPRKNV